MPVSLELNDPASNKETSSRAKRLEKERSKLSSSFLHLISETWSKLLPNSQRAHFTLKKNYKEVLIQIFLRHCNCSQNFWFLTNRQPRVTFHLSFTFRIKKVNWPIVPFLPTACCHCSKRLQWKSDTSENSEKCQAWLCSEALEKAWISSPGMQCLASLHKAQDKGHCAFQETWKWSFGYLSLDPGLKHF